MQRCLLLLEEKQDRRNQIKWEKGQRSERMNYIKAKNSHKFKFWNNLKEEELWWIFFLKKRTMHKLKALLKKFLSCFVPHIFVPSSETIFTRKWRLWKCRKRGEEKLFHLSFSLNRTECAGAKNRYKFRWFSMRVYRLSSIHSHTKSSHPHNQTLSCTFQDNKILLAVWQQLEFSKWLHHYCQKRLDTHTHTHTN